MDKYEVKVYDPKVKKWQVWLGAHRYVDYPKGKRSWESSRELSEAFARRFGSNAVLMNKWKFGLFVNDKLRERLN